MDYVPKDLHLRLSLDFHLCVHACPCTHSHAHKHFFFLRLWVSYISVAVNGQKQLGEERASFSQSRTCPSYFSTAVTEHCDQGNLRNKAFN